MKKLEIGDVIITKKNSKVTYYLLGKMTGNKLKEFKVKNNEKINNFLKK